MSVDLPRSALEYPANRAEPAASVLRRFGKPRARTALAALPFIGCAIAWAIADGTSPALALLVGYSAVASTIGLALSAPSKKTADSERAPTRTPAEGGISVAWTLVSTFTISDASRLWCNIEPGATATLDSMAWGRALLDAVKQGDLPIVTKGASPEASQQERQNPHYMTQVTRAALKHWADQKGHTPQFLRD